MNLLSCVDCRWCQPNPTKDILKCKKGEWVNDHGLKKSIKLDNLEINSFSDEKVKIKNRKIFKLADTCNYLESMDE